MLPARTFVGRIESLPPLPQVVHRVLVTGESPHASADDLAAVLLEDQALAARILRVANSPFYGTGRRITQVSRAVAMLGTVNVRQLVVGLAARSAWPDGPPPAREHSLLWRHSIAVASASELIARTVNFAPVETAFIAGLLHDMGRLAILVFRPSAFKTALREAACTTSLRQMERRLVGLDHAQAGDHVMRRWGLPEHLCAVTRRHHEHRIGGRDEPSDLHAIVMLADACAHTLGMALDLPLGRLDSAEAARRHLGLSEAQHLGILERLERRIVEISVMMHAATSDDLPPRRGRHRSVAWISCDGGCSNKLGQFVLEHTGCTISHGGPADLRDRTYLESDMVVVCLPPAMDVDARDMAAELAARGHRRVVILSEPAPGQPLRRRDTPTGALRVPPAFTVCDVEWAMRARAGAPAVEV